MSSPQDWTRGTAALLLSECGKCGRRWYLPAEQCPDCGCPRQRWFSACGDGRCVALTRWPGAAEDCTDQEPALVLVELAEGPLVLGRVNGNLQPGDEAHLKFIESNTLAGLLPSFQGNEENK